MKIIREISEMKEFRSDLKGNVGLVPTMGCLHLGHLELVKQSIRDNSATIVSIFVNPTQFGPCEDFAKYPRDEQHDIDVLEQAGVNAVFIPSTDGIYPKGFGSWVEVKGVTEVLEGARREGHFRGVATVCHKLFNIILPTRAYFGQKDAQQVLTVKKMVTDLNMHVEIMVVPIVRETDGLAMSSRNSYLSPAERCAATVLYQALISAQDLYVAGERNAKAIAAAVTTMLQSEPLAKVDYVAITDTINLQELEIISSSALVLLAVYIGETRLIDNIILGM